MTEPRNIFGKLIQLILVCQCFILALSVGASGSFPDTNHGHCEKQLVHELCEGHESHSEHNDCPVCANYEAAIFHNHALLKKNIQQNLLIIHPLLHRAPNITYSVPLDRFTSVPNRISPVLQAHRTIVILS